MRLCTAKLPVKTVLLRAFWASRLQHRPAERVPFADYFSSRGALVAGGQVRPDAPPKRAAPPRPGTPRMRGSGGLHRLLFRARQVAGDRGELGLQLLLRL